MGRADAPAFSALAEGIIALQSGLERMGFGDDGFRILIPARLGNRIEAELCRADPAYWRELTPGIGIYADGHLKQFVLCECITVGWKLGIFNEGKKGHGQPSRSTGNGC